MQEPGLGMLGGGGGGIGGLSNQVSASAEQQWRLKAEIVTHPLCEQLLAAHIGCLRVATPIDQLPLIDAQLLQSHHLLRSYATQHHHQHHVLSPHERQDLDNFLEQYLVVLCSFKEQLQQHVRVHAVEAVMACRDIEQSLQALTGITLGEGTGATMSDDEDELQMDCTLDQSGADGHDMMGFGPLLPTESERSLMDRVRQELKIELKQGFRSKIEDVREEILRKRKAGKLPGDTTSVLKHWWQEHSKWPYPTEDDKAKLVGETGLQLKQINNWFINQRKRNWHSNSQSVTSSKSKRKTKMMFQASFLLLVLMAATSYASLETQTYVVHMDHAKITALDRSLGNTKRWYEAVINSIVEFSAQEDEDEEEEAPSPQLLYVYETAIAGFAAKLSTKQVESLKNIDGFLSATPDYMLNLHTTHSPQFLGLRNGRGLWKAPNLASDVIIGIIDTGIWPEHTSFNDFGMSAVPTRWKGACEEGTKFSPSNCNKKLIGGRAFFKGYEASAGRINETVDYRSARDAEGHGTHTASTAAGNVVTGASLFGMAKGAAGGMRFTARIAAYKVCFAAGCTSSDILAAIDQAVADGVDVLSLSLGGANRPYHSDNMAIAAFGAVRNGVFVSCSAGNSGPSESTVANTSPWIMTVAASSLDRSFPTKVKLGNGQEFKGASLYSGKPTKALMLVYGDTAGGQGAEYCSDGSLSPKLVKGKIVVCERGMNGRTAKGEQVKMAGGAGMLLLNTEEQGEELIADPHILPASSLGAAAAKAIKNYVSTDKKPMASIIFQGTVYGYAAPVMTAFSSRGPSSVSPDVIKPDVTAPGMNILAAWPPMVSPTKLKSDKRSVLFNIISGTSMSCPHVSGLAALLKSVHKDWSPAAIKSALMTTAYTLNNKRAPITDAGSDSSESATPFAFGSGHVNPESASNPGLIYDITTEDYLNYLCSLNYTSSQIAILSRGSYSCPTNTVLQPGDLNYPSFALLFDSGAQNITVTYKRTVTNVGSPRTSYAVQMSQPDGVSMIVEPKVINFKKFGEKQSYKVTFVAVGGKTTSTTSSFGSLFWVSEKFTVRSPIAVTWQ
ncbi:hypothetical protein HHK36_000300 [Tetracentron sinense]|uniref:Uncharacterized protein n=1 Tax=Tetracentron sinense TaxID=13715 RepID=A0A835DQU9_TETSI|nr:hypothetical protein HHK36_000300 [Tetracentron sinense]